MSKAKQRGEYKKIDIYAKVPYGERYLCSTKASPNLKVAKERYCLSNDNVGGYGPSDLTTYYAGK